MSRSKETAIAEGSLDIGHARGAKTGNSYIEGLRDSREVWLNGEKVDVTTHTAFKGNLTELARLYDLQHTPALQKQMTFVSPDTGNLVSYSYSLPDSPTELELKWRNSHIWMENSWGQLPRLPDFMSNVMVGVYDYRNELGLADPRFKQNAVNYYTYCREHDICLTHALGDPQIDRSGGPAIDPDMALRVMKETADGVIVCGAKQLATLAPVADEVLIYLSPSFAMREHKEFVLWAALPLATPGLKVLCREPQSHANEACGHSHPFAWRYDEQDAMLFFDNVLIPWERVLLLYNSEIAAKGFERINAWSLYSGQIRFYHRLQTFIGVASLLAESIGVNGFREICNSLGELASYAQMTKLVLKGLQQEAYLTNGGLYAPGDTTASGVFAAQVSPRLVEILKEIAASGLVMQPSEADLSNPELKPFLEKYMRGKDIDVYQKSRLFRLAWDLAGDSYGMRQELYEHWYRGDIVRNRINLFAQYDCKQIKQKLKSLISKPIQP
ncbi:4-hydroxyphenylacetate 3-monooxygenase, oxygenase component [Nibrella saemangeumensis]|uniref:4-hydroxyphenylacetate 3-monooxygenase, oxygenase component n=1 Tax=Nibrella saemangeumensis TaxID=1084526 RepID=A0ABP8N822_9BACT